MKFHKTKLRILATVLSTLLVLTAMPALTALAEGEYEATLMGQLDTDVNDSIGEWDLENLPEATVRFDLGTAATIVIEFSEPIKFTGNWTGISTDIPVDGDEAAEAILGGITSFKIDDIELGARQVPLIDRDNNGLLTIDIARQWGGSYDAYDLENMDPFSKLEITFILGVEVDFEATDQGDDHGPPSALDLVSTFNVWIGGTFLTDEGEYDWVPHEDQSVPFKINEPFTVTLDYGSETTMHGEASWGYIVAIQTDIMDSAVENELVAFIDEILLDGVSISFNNSNVGVGFDRGYGIRISLTSTWADESVVQEHHLMGIEFSKLEVTMAFMELGSDNPFTGEAAEEPEDTPPPSAPPPVIIPPPAPEDVPEDSSDSDGFPLWAIIAIIAGGVVVIAVVVVLLIMKHKR